MNTSIKRLYEKTIGKEWAYDFDPDLAEKFAELIINECAQIARLHALKRGERSYMVHSVIKEHFGVEQ